MSFPFLDSGPEIRINAEFPGAVEVGVAFASEVLEVSISCARGGVSSISLTWNVDFLVGGYCFQDAWERGYGDLGWYTIDSQRHLPWFSAVSNASGVWGFGVRTQAKSFAHWTLEEGKITLHLDVRSGSLPCLLNGRTLVAAEIIQLSGSSCVDLCGFMRILSQQLCPNPRLAGFPVYGANDWYYAYGNNTRDGILQDSKRVSRWSQNPDNRPFSVIDAGWQPNGGCEGGPWDAGNSRFGDMGRLARDIAETGCRPGIWIRPLLVGEPIDDRLTMHPGTLDPSLPENLDRVRRDISRCREWGFELIKHDFSSWDCTGRWGFEMADGVFGNDRQFHNREKTSAEIFGDLYDSIRSAAGEALLIGCNTFGHLAAGTHEIQRTGDDTSGKEWSRTLKMGVNTLAFRSIQHDTLFAADADCVGITPQIDWRLNRMWLDAVARSGTPLFVSASSEALGVEQEAALTEAFDLASRPQAVAVPEDWLATLTPHRWSQGTTQSEYGWA